MKSRAPSGILCSVCQGRNLWTIGEYTTRLQAADAPLAGVGYPQVVLTCKNCGHTVLLNAIVMGLEKGLGKSIEEGGAPKEGED